MTEMNVKDATIKVDAIPAGDPDHGLDLGASIDAQIVDAAIKKNRTTVQAQQRRKPKRQVKTSTPAKTLRIKPSSGRTARNSGRAPKKKTKRTQIDKTIAKADPSPPKVIPRRIEEPKIQRVTKVESKPESNLTGLRFRVSSIGAKVQQNAPRLKQGWRRLAPGGTMIKVSNQTGP